jgi:hypothetical protein
VTGQQYEQALAEVMAASGGMWTPVYRELLVDLGGALRSAGDRYDRAADAVGTPAEQRFDWRGYLPDSGPHIDADTDRVNEQTP